MASYVIEGPAVLFYGAANCAANEYEQAPAGNGTQYVLGITESGVSLSTSLMTHRLSTDVYGGTEGPPADLLVLGGQASIRGTLVKWGADSLKALTTGLFYQEGFTGHGVFPWPGEGVWGGGHGFSIWVVGSIKSYYFPRCELASQPREWNISALERRMSLNINAYNTSGTTPHLYFTETSANNEPYLNSLYPTCHTLD